MIEIVGIFSKVEYGTLANDGSRKKIEIFCYDQIINLSSRVNDYEIDVV